MLNKNMIGRFYPSSSLIHKMHPLSKVIGTVLFMIVIFFVHTVPLNILLTGLICYLMLLSKVPIRYYVKVIWSMKFFLLFVVIIELLCGVSIYFTIITLLHFVLILFNSAILTFTTMPLELSYGLELFFSPLSFFHLPVKKMAMTMTLALRFIPMTIDTGNKILKSMASRGIDYEHSSILDKMQVIKAMLIPMMRISLLHADTLANTMALRLYQVGNKRTHYHIHCWSWFDTYYLFIHGMILAMFLLEMVMA